MKQGIQIVAIFLAMLGCCESALPVSAQTSLQDSASSTPATPPAKLPPAKDGTWYFGVSGDSRNCGDVVMPAIAAGVKKDNASFYWHLGDFRAIYDFDEDMQHQPRYIAKPLTIIQYENVAWDDFIQSQVLPFAPVQVFLGIGNHDTTPPKTREQYLIQFADWLNQPVLQQQRLRDAPNARKLTAYFHWNQAGVDFISMDNATPDQFDYQQMAWFEKTLQLDANDPSIHTIVVGMHEALPFSISENHSMDQFAVGDESGRRVYIDLLKAQNEAHKRIYTVASHSHYYMEGIFNTEYWRAHGGILPGWIVGTAGAVRYSLPPEKVDAVAAETNVYGYLIGAVKPNGEINFTFHRLSESDVPADIMEMYKPEFVHWCFVKNSEAH